MAVLSGYPGLKVEILVHGAALQEYDNESEPETADKISKYIESKSGEHFAILFTVSEPFQRGNLAVKIFLDGERVSHKHYDADELFDPAGHEVDGESTKSGTQTFKHKYVFAVAETSKSKRRTTFTHF